MLQLMHCHDCPLVTHKTFMVSMIHQSLPNRWTTQSSMSISRLINVFYEKIKSLNIILLRPFVGAIVKPFNCYVVVIKFVHQKHYNPKLLIGTTNPCVTQA